MCAVTFLIALQFLAWNKPESLCVSSKTKNKLETDMAAVLSCDVQSVLSFQCHACCIVGKTVDFPVSKNKHKQMSVLEPFDDSCMWKEFQTCRLFSQFRIRAGLSTFYVICSSCLWAQLHITHQYFVQGNLPSIQ